MSFGELRSLLLSAAPSASTFSALCLLLDDLPAARYSEEVEPYVLAHLARWPAELRQAPKRWIEQALQDDQDAMLRLGVASSWGLIAPKAIKLPTLQRWLTYPCWTRLHELRVGGWALSSRWPVLAQAERLDALHSLSLAGAKLAPADWDALAATTSPPLRRLDLGRLYLSEDKLMALSHALWWPKLAALNLSDNMLTGEALSYVARRGVFAGLAQLDLSVSQLGPQLNEVLPELGPSLHTLTLTDAALTDSSLAAFEPARFQLSELHLSHNRISAQGIHTLSHAKATSTLEGLDLSHNPLSDRGLIALLDAPAAQTLRWLDVSMCQITDDGAVALAQRAEALPHLHRLNLKLNPIGQRGLMALARVARFKDALAAA